MTQIYPVKQNTNSVFILLIRIIRVPIFVLAILKFILMRLS